MNKKTPWNLSRTYLEQVNTLLLELQCEFEDEENLHDMATISDIRQDVARLEQRLAELPAYLLSQELNES